MSQTSIHLAHSDRSCKNGTDIKQDFESHETKCHPASTVSTLPSLADLMRTPNNIQIASPPSVPTSKTHNLKILTKKGLQ